MWDFKPAVDKRATVSHPILLNEVNSTILHSTILQFYKREDFECLIARVNCTKEKKVLFLL